MTGTNNYRSRKERDNDVDSSGLLFNTLLKRLHLSTDKALGDWLGISAPRMSRIRHGLAEVDAKTILHVHEHLNMPVKDIRKLINGGTIK